VVFERAFLIIVGAGSIGGAVVGAIAELGGYSDDPKIPAIGAGVIAGLGLGLLVIGILYRRP
jgi:hypothetical protein